MLSHVRVFLTPWTVARQAPLSMGFPLRECWSRLPFPTPGDLSHSGIEPASPALASGFFTTEPPGKPVYFYCPREHMSRAKYPTFIHFLSYKLSGFSNSSDSEKYASFKVKIEDSSNAF